MRIKWTDQQKRAIAARGSDVLVTASAGTGKTAVLSGRCVDIVSDISGHVDVSNILVLTFTDAAAEQMRSRIAEQLRTVFTETGDRHLRQQLILLQASDISTIHSFCKRLITEYFYELGLDPTFSVIDADEAQLLKAEALEKTIDWAWQQSNLSQGLTELLRGRDLQDNAGFLTKIIELSNFLDSVVLRKSWYQRAAQLTQATTSLSGGLGQKQIIAEKLQRILSRLLHAQKMFEAENTAGDWVVKLQASHIEPVKSCLEILQSGDWNKCAELIRDFSKPKTLKPKDVPEPIAELLQKTAKKAIEGFKRLSDLSALNPDYLDRVGSAANLQTRVLIELIRKFDQLYGQAKRSLNCMDFADLEHNALRLLADVETEEDDELSPSQTALSLRQKYKYIFVDEYQDINPVQQAILNMLSSQGNVFVVGDVKQSIYAFRGAEPNIFAENLRLASLDPANASNKLRVDLNVNFRSTKGILDFVNRLFSRIMSAAFAQIEYDDSAKLRPASAKSSNGRASNGQRPAVEFHILDETDKGEDSENGQVSESEQSDDLSVITSRQRQAALIAQRIRQMVGADTGKAEFQVHDTRQNCLRDVQYSDIVILMRSLVKKANDYVEVLRLAGVPVSCQAAAGYFEATEITDMLSLLKVLDNPQRDIELAAVLRSPFFTVCDSELAKIRIHGTVSGQPKNFHCCVHQYSEGGVDKKLALKLKDIIEKIDYWRSLARRGRLADLIWQIYRQTNYLAFVSALPNGQARKANLLKLHDRAIQFEGFVSSTGIPSLTRFIEFIEKLLELGQDWAPAEPESAVGNAVRILSVHKSKGLEFPVVFLAELQSEFNKKDITAEVLADADGTLGLQVIDRATNSKLCSVAHEVVAERKLSTILAEEIRILYVAMTRAKDRLILTGSQKRIDCGAVLSNGLFFTDGPIADWQLRSCQSPLEWILYGFSDQKVLHTAFRTGFAEKTVENNLFTFQLHDRAELNRISNHVLQLKISKSKRSVLTPSKTPRKQEQSKLLLKVKKSLSWSYSFGDAPSLPAKSSVTELSHQSDEYRRFDYSTALDRQPIALAVSEFDLTESPQSKLIGTATHLVISQLDLTGPVTRQKIDNLRERLVDNATIAAAVAERIDTESIFDFFQSDLGQLVLDPDNTIRREWPFTFALPASQFADSDHESRATSDEIIVVQGIIDMLIRAKQGLIIIDYKTDRIKAEEVPKRAELYCRQLGLYGQAASAVLKTELVTKWLYFLSPRIAFRL